MEEKLQAVQEFLSRIDQDESAQQRFGELAASGDLDGFAKWAEESGCDLELLRSLAAPPEGELSDEDLEQVSGGAGFFLSFGGGGRVTALSSSSRVAGIRNLFHRIGERYPRVDQRGLPRPPSEWAPK